MYDRNTMDPIPLKESVSMEYCNFPELPEYLCIDNNVSCPPHKNGGQRALRQFEPIVPNENDILMGRGGKNNQHIGNENFRKLARKEAKEYCTSSKKGKSNIAKGLVTKVRQMTPPGRFLKRNPITSEWEDVGDEYAREKASQVLRDAVGLLLESNIGDIKHNSDTDEAPELFLEPTVSKKATRKKMSLKRKADLPPPPPIYSYGYSYAPQAWQYQSMPPLAPPPLKRYRSNNFFERYAFFPTNGKNDSSRSLGAIPPGPCLSRQGSLCASVGNMSLPGESLLLDDQALLDTPDLLLRPPSLQAAVSDEFFSDFY